MTLNAMIPDLVKATKDHESYLDFNGELFDIYQGKLLPYIEKELRSQLSPQSYAQAQFRIPPINVLKRIIDKLAKVYAIPPMRTTTGTEQETELVSWYEECFRINQRMSTANAYFNLFKNCLIEPFVHRPDPFEAGKPKLRVYSSNKFVVLSWDKQDPTVPTAVVVYQGKYQPTATGSARRYYVAWDAQQFVYFDEDKRDITALFAPENNPTGINPYGRLPFVYLNRSLDQTMPVQDTDTRRMSTLIPILLADTNYASMFQAFSILYGIDVNFEGLKMDTAEDRKEQLPFFKDAEEELWDLVLHYMHPVWKMGGWIDNQTDFAPSSYVTVTFPDQIPLNKRGDVLNEVVTELNNGLTTKERALKRLNPELTEEEVAELVGVLEARRPVVETPDEEQEDDDDGMAEDEDRAS